MVTELQAGRYTVRGVSLGGIYTALHVPELDALFDVGCALRSGCSSRNLFLSHGHVDHLGALPALVGMRGLTGVEAPLRVFLPAPLVDDLREMLGVYGRLHRWPLDVELVPLEPGDEAEVRPDLRVRAFRTFHPVPALGYLFFRRVRKLRDEFLALPGPEIATRRQAGEDLFREVDHLELAYATDTLPRVLDTVPELFRVRTLILECTFLDQRKSIDAARAGCHIHLDELLPYVSRFENDAVVLMHFSQLYKPGEVLDILADRCPSHFLGRMRALVPQSTETWWI